MQGSQLHISVLYVPDSGRAAFAQKCVSYESIHYIGLHWIYLFILFTF